MLADLMKQAARSCMEESGARLLFGTVIAESPLEIRVEDRFTLKGERLILPDTLIRREQEIQCKDETHTVILCPGLKAGDKVALVRAGEFFLVAGPLGAWQ